MASLPDTTIEASISFSTLTLSPSFNLKVEPVREATSWSISTSSFSEIDPSETLSKTTKIETSFEVDAIARTSSKL